MFRQAAKTARHSIDIFQRPISQCRTSRRLHVIIRKALACVAVALLFASSTWVLGQAVSATLLGTITDKTGASVADVTVTITVPATGATTSTQTNNSGNYTFPDLAPGTYRVAGEAKGFKREVRENIEVTVNSTTRIDMELQPGSVTE